MNSTMETHWMSIEAMNTKNYMVQDIFWLPKTIRNSIGISNEFLLTTIIIRDTWKSKLIREYSPYRMLYSLAWTTEDIKAIVSNWKTQNFFKLKDIFCNEALLTKTRVTGSDQYSPSLAPQLPNANSFIMIGASGQPVQERKKNTV